MAKHNKAADEVMKGKNFKHLGRFRNRKFLEQGHNTTGAGDCGEANGCSACSGQPAGTIKCQTCLKNALISGAC